MTNREFIRLAGRWRTGQMSDAEAEAFVAACNSGAFDELLMDTLETHLISKDLLDSKPVKGEERVWEKIGMGEAEAPGVKVHRIGFFRKWGWVAASVLVIVATAVWFILSPEQPSGFANRQTTGTATEIAPGKNGAVLTLADGQEVLLDTITSGRVIALQGGAAVRVTDGKLVYEGLGEQVLYNTIRTPKGRQFRLTLPDGTEVWLNSASEIRYPTAFAGNERKVEMKGELYFEVAKNAGNPFRVKINEVAEVEVLGTHFNVNAYENEYAVRTTLLEGHVRAYALLPGQAAYAENVMLNPGQQAAIGIPPAGSKDPPAIQINAPDISRVVAWKNGLFYFDGATVRELMRQLERWYDITVKYEHGWREPNIEFEGKMYRDVPLSEVLNMLQEAGISFRTEERTIIVQ